MPRANDNRKAVGTEHCNTCGTLGRFYQVQKGNRTGYLYYRCECGADQRSGAAVQVKWLKSMKRTGETMIHHPLDKSGDEPAEPAGTPEPKPAEPLATSEGNPEKETPKAGMIGLAAMAGAVILAVLT